MGEKFSKGYDSGVDKKVKTKFAYINDVKEAKYFIDLLELWQDPQEWHKGDSLSSGRMFLFTIFTLHFLGLVTESSLIWVKQCIVETHHSELCMPV